ncbi:MAG: PQQ-binding-like beta-propeller repeat protein [Nitrososphaeraceae archaeon]
MKREVFILILLCVLPRISGIGVSGESPAHSPDWKYEIGNSVWSVSINQDGYVAAGSGDKYVRLFDRKGDLLWKYEAGDSVESVSINQDGYVAAGSINGYVYLFDGKGDLLWKYKTGESVSASINQDGYVAAGSFDDCVYLCLFCVNLKICYGDMVATVS